jgi:CDP-diacylglycerol---glycerol-3-phosphate 3-phosphatidyltransferase
VLNLPNKITISRIILIPIFMAFLLTKASASVKFLSVDIQWGALAAGAVFVLAAATDGLDGYIARSRNEVTAVGQLLDPLADKLLVSAALITLVGLGRLSAWVAVIIIGREFAVTGLRMSAAVKHVVIPAGKLGKYKTVFQIIAVTVLILQIPMSVFGLYIEGALVSIALILTLISGIDYFIKGSHVLLDDDGQIS